MKNPWLKKNPLMSIWLSSANSVAGSVRGKATAQAKRQAKTAMTTGNKQMIDFWLGKPVTRQAKKKQ